MFSRIQERELISTAQRIRTECLTFSRPGIHKYSAVSHWGNSSFIERTKNVLRVCERVRQFRNLLSALQLQSYITCVIYVTLRNKVIQSRVKATVLFS